MPAFACTASSFPNRSTIVCTSRSTSSPCDTSVRTKVIAVVGRGDRLAAGGVDVGDHDLRALRRQPLGRRAADAARAAGDDRDATIEAVRDGRADFRRHEEPPRAGGGRSIVADRAAPPLCDGSPACGRRAGPCGWRKRCLAPDSPPRAPPATIRDRRGRELRETRSEYARTLHRSARWGYRMSDSVPGTGSDIASRFRAPRRTGRADRARAGAVGAGSFPNADAVRPRRPRNPPPAARARGMPPPPAPRSPPARSGRPSRSS